MHLNILSPQQCELLPLIRRFRRSFMKAFALGRRAKWKDYVDLYFILTDHHSINAVTAKAEDLFGGQFSGKLFREQLCFFADVDYTESIDYLVPSVTDERIREGLINLSTGIL